MKTAILLLAVLAIPMSSEATERPKPIWPWLLVPLAPLVVVAEIISPGWMDRATAGSGFDSRTWTAEEMEIIEADRARTPELHW
jgi:hypothetical protein